MKKFLLLLLWLNVLALVVGGKYVAPIVTCKPTDYILNTFWGKYISDSAKLELSEIIAAIFTVRNR